MDTRSKAKYLSEFTDSDGNCTVPIFKAIIADNMEMLEHLLEQSDTDINYKSEDDNNTALLLSLTLQRNDALIMRLIRAGCDPNISNKHGVSPLHLAVLRSTIDIAHELIKRGSDINALDDCWKSPMFEAAAADQRDAVCMLLYYDADVNNSKKKKGTSPVGICLELGHDNIARLLLKHCSRDDAVLTCAKYIGLASCFNLLLELFKAETLSNQVVGCVSSDLRTFTSSKFLEFPWSTLNYQKFTYRLMRHNNLSPSEWLECLYALLQSSLASSAILLQLKKAWYKHNLFHEFLQALKCRYIDRKDRVALIYAFLNLGVNVKQCDIEMLYQDFGFNEELEAVIYCSKLDGNFYSNSILQFILVVDTEVSSEYLLERCERACIAEGNLLYFRQEVPPMDLRFFALSVKQQLKLMKSGNRGIHEKLKVVPEIPSLVELARNRVRFAINRNYKIDVPYQFYDVVKKLNLPQIIQDIICFRKPLY